MRKLVLLLTFAISGNKLKEDNYMRLKRFEVKNYKEKFTMDFRKVYNYINS